MWSVPNKTYLLRPSFCDEWFKSLSSGRDEIDPAGVERLCSQIGELVKITWMNHPMFSLDKNIILFVHRNKNRRSIFILCILYSFLTIRTNRASSRFTRSVGSCMADGCQANGIYYKRRVESGEQTLFHRINRQANRRPQTLLQNDALWFSKLENG